MILKRLKFFVLMIKEAVQEFLTDNCTHLAAAISYYMLLSLFPLALAAISILSLVSRSPNAEARVVDAITAVLPLSRDLVLAAIADFSPGVGAAGAIATIGLIWAGMAVFNAIRKSLNTAWGIKTPRPFLRERLIELVMMLGFAAFLFVSVGVTTAFTIIRDASIHVFGERFLNGGFVWQAVVIAASTVLAFVGFLFLYKFVPNTKVRWRHVWVGAIIAAVLFEITKNIFVWFVGEFATYNLVYGSIGTLIALMSWTYISAVIMLFCAKVISIYTGMKSSLLEDAPIVPSSIDKSPRSSPKLHGGWLGRRWPRI
jgi:membrane protein